MKRTGRRGEEDGFFGGEFFVGADVTDALELEFATGSGFDESSDGFEGIGVEAVFDVVFSTAGLSLVKRRS